MNIHNTKFTVTAYNHKDFEYCVIRQELDKNRQVESEVVVAICASLYEANTTMNAIGRTLVLSTEVV